MRGIARRLGYCAGHRAGDRRATAYSARSSTTRHWPTGCTRRSTTRSALRPCAPPQPRRLRTGSPSPIWFPARSHAPPGVGRHGTPRDRGLRRPSARQLWRWAEADAGAVSPQQSPRAVPPPRHGARCATPPTRSCSGLCVTDGPDIDGVLRARYEASRREPAEGTHRYVRSIGGGGAGRARVWCAWQTNCAASGSGPT